MLSIQEWLESQLEYGTRERREKVEELRITSEGLEGELDLSDFFGLKKLFCGNNKITRLILPFPNKLERVDAKYEEIQDRGESKLKNEPFYDERKSPIFVCAHASNAPWQVDHSLSKGVNAMETDIWKDGGGQIWAAHDNILDEGKATKIEEFLDHLKENVFATEKGDNKVQNFIYSCGRIPGVPATLEEIRKELKVVVDLHKNSKGQVFGVYTWTLRDLVSSKEWLENLFLNGIIGDTSELFGLLPRQLPENLRLGKRSDGVNVWSAVIQENLNAVLGEGKLVELEAQVQIPPKK